HGRWDAAGLPRRAALLVAQNPRSHVSGRLGQIFSARRIRWFQPDVSAAIHTRLHGHAAPLSLLPGRVSGAARAVNRGRFDSRRGPFDSAALSALVDALRQNCRAESVAFAWTRM